MTTLESTDVVRHWQEWHAEREDALRAPHGWLSLTGLHWLDAAPAAYPNLRGTWRATGDGGVEITAAASCGLEIDGTIVDGTVRVEPVDGLPGRSRSRG